MNFAVNTAVQTALGGRFDGLLKSGGLLALANAVGAVTSRMGEHSIAIAIATATTAVENNFVKSAERAAERAGGEEEERAADANNSVYGKSTGRSRSADGSGSKARALSPYSRSLLESIDHYQEAIQHEKAFRSSESVGVLDKTKSYATEWGLRQAIGDASREYQNRQMVKGLEYVSQGQATSQDLHHIGMGLAGVAVGATMAKGTGGKVPGTKVPTKAEATKVVQRPVLPGEGKVGTYAELKRFKTREDNLARHHMPNDQYMNSHAVKRDDGVSMMVEHPIPGIGGRHREIHKQLQKQDTSMAPRSALAQSVARAREVYQGDRVYTPEIRKNLQDVVERNKQLHPTLFSK